MQQTKLYAISDENGFIKIGIARNTRTRMAGLQIGNASRLSIINEYGCNTRADAHQVEYHLHSCLRQLKTGASGEWFIPSIFTTIVVAAMLPWDIQGAIQTAMDLWCDHADSQKQYRLPTNVT